MAIVNDTVQLEFAIHDYEMPKIVTGDEKRLSYIINKLIRNAILRSKFKRLAPSGVEPDMEKVKVTCMYLTDLSDWTMKYPAHFDDKLAD